MGRMKMYKFIIPIGDWSKDGHNQSEDVIIECNYPVEEVREAYKKSCLLTGIQFNNSGVDQNYTGLPGDWKEQKKREIATEYEDAYISLVQYRILSSFGINVDKYIESDDDQEFIDANGRMGYILGVSYFVNLLMEFIGLSLSKFKWKVVKNELPYLNGYWDKDLNVSFGYGLFS